MVKQTITIPSTRIYLDDLSKEDRGSLMLSFHRFNIMSEIWYNRMYENEYLGTEKTNLADLKQDYLSRFKTDVQCPEYYYTSMYSTASGMLSSQKSLYNLQTSQRKQRMKHQKEKMDDIKKELSSLQSVKENIIKYYKKLKSEEERYEKAKKKETFTYHLPKIKMTKYIPEKQRLVRENGSAFYDDEKLYLFEVVAGRPDTAIKSPYGSDTGKIQQESGDS